MLVGNKLSIDEEVMAETEIYFADIKFEACLQNISIKYNRLQKSKVTNITLNSELTR